MGKKVLYIRSIVVGRELAAGCGPFIDLGPMSPWIIEEVVYCNKYVLPEKDRKAMTLASESSVETVDLCFAPLIVRFHAFLIGISETPALRIDGKKKVGLEAVAESLRPQE